MLGLKSLSFYRNYCQIGYCEEIKCLFDLFSMCVCVHVCEHKSEVKQVLRSLLPTKLHGNQAVHTYTPLSKGAVEKILEGWNSVAQVASHLCA